MQGGETLVGGRYAPAEILSEDGSCSIVRAVDRHHDRIVWMRIRAFGSDDARRELLRQAQVLLGVTPHPGLPVVRDDFFEGDRHVLVRDWVDGTPLSRRLRSDGDPGLPPSAVLGWLRQAAGALDHLHSQRPPVAHGAISPSKLVATDDGRVMLVDAGLAGPRPDATAWSAPEVAAGAAPTPAADIYGLAATALTLLTGVSDPADAGAWAGIDPSFAKVAQRALRRGLDPDPARRPRSAPELVERLHHAYEAELPTGELTFCLTDVEASTPLWEAQPAAMQEAMTHLRDLIADLVEQHGGRLPRSQGEGDSTLSVFSRAADAVAMIVGVHRALASDPGSDGITLRIRAGLHTGQAELREGDYFGASVSRTARLRGLAGGGHTVLSAATANLVVDELPAGTSLVPLGERELKGLSRPESVFELVDTQVPPGSASLGAATTPVDALDAGPAPQLSLPPSLDRQESTVFVGRGDAVRCLHESWAAAMDGRRLLVTVAGPPGIGKTRLVSEAARAVHADGATVLFGRSYEENLRPYGPVAEALRHLVLDPASAPLLAEHVATFGPYLARLVPEVATRLPQLPTALRDDPETERFLLFESVVGLLGAAAGRAPLLLVLDDLHWADRPTLLLIAHLLRATDRAAIGVVGTYRDTEVERDSALAHLLADLRRDQQLEQITLSGLSDDEVAALIAAFEVHDVPESLTRAVSRDTEGNPFFIGEVLRHLIETDALHEQGGRWSFAPDTVVVEVPESIRDLLGRRMSRLPDDVVRVLRVGAVIGRNFDLSLLAQVTESPVDEVLDRLEQAMTARVIAEDPDRFGRYTFTHALIRQTLYSEMSVTRRALEHQRIAAVLEPLAEEGDGEQLRALAHHLLVAAPAGDARAAVQYALRAGRAAMDALAYEEAATWFERGLAVTHDPTQRGTVLLALGDARHGSGTKEPARDAICEAAAIARDIGDAELLAHAALGFSTSGAAVGIGTEWGVVDQPVVDLLEEALDGLEPGDSPLRARLLARLGAALYFSHDVDRLTELSSTALEMSHRVGDKRSMAMALAARHSARWLPGTVEERRDIAQEVLNLAEVVGDRELILQSYAFLVAAYMELNDRTAVDHYIEAAGRLADAVKRPQYLWWKRHWDASIALLEGRLDQAEELIGEALQIGQENQGHNALNTFAIQTLILRLHQGRAGELEPVVRASIDSYPDLPSWWTGLVVIGIGTGDESLLRESYDHLALDRFGVLPRDAMWHAAMVMLAWASCSLDDTEGARILYEMLSPLEGRNVHVGAGAVYFGSVDRYLGMLALQLGEWDTAETHFTHALEMQDAMGGRIFSVVTLLNISDLLRTRNGAGDAQRAIDTCHEARRRADELKIDALSAWVARELQRAATVADGKVPN